MRNANTSPQFEGRERTYPELVPKSSEELEAKKFGHDVCNLIGGWNMSQVDLLLRHFISNKMYIEFHMFGPRMQYRIRRQCDCAQVINPNCWSRPLLHLQFTQE